MLEFVHSDGVTEPSTTGSTGGQVIGTVQDRSCLLVKDRKHYIQMIAIRETSSDRLDVSSLYIHGIFLVVS